MTVARSNSPSSKYQPVDVSYRHVLYAGVIHIHDRTSHLIWKYVAARPMSVREAIFSLLLRGTKGKAGAPRLARSMGIEGCDTSASSMRMYVPGRQPSMRARASASTPLRAYRQARLYICRTAALCVTRPEPQRPWRLRPAWRNASPQHAQHYSATRARQEFGGNPSRRVWLNTNTTVFVGVGVWCNRQSTDT